MQSCPPLKGPGRRRFNPECRKTRGNLRRPPRGAENASGTCGTHSRPRSGASPDGGPATTSARAACGLTSSGARRTSWRCEAACARGARGALAGREEEAARSARLHLMETRGGSSAPGARGRARRPAGNFRSGGWCARPGVSRCRRRSWRPRGDGGRPATQKASRILVFCTCKLQVSVAPAVQDRVPRQQVASSPAFLLQAWSPEGRLPQPAHPCPCFQCPALSPCPPNPTPSLASRGGIWKSTVEVGAHRELAGQELTETQGSSGQRPSPVLWAASVAPISFQNLEQRRRLEVVSAVWHLGALFSAQSRWVVRQTLRPCLISTFQRPSPWLAVQNQQHLLFC